MKQYSLLIKPASADCNLNCEYCFYLERGGLYPETKVHRMSEEALERLVSSYMASGQRHHIFGWQGGEPTLMGLGFFKKAVELQQKCGSPGAIVSNGLQTNGTLIDDEMASFFAEWKFLLGVSLDGPEPVHDKYRRARSGAPSYAMAMKGIEALRRNNAEFNILCLVSEANVGRAAEIYRHFVSNGFNYLQFIPCVEFDGEGRLLPLAISGEAWGRFLCELFDEWRKSDSMKVSIRAFDAIMNYLLDGSRTVCHFGGNCRQYFVVEFNGDVYPCDFFVRSHLKLGNLMLDSWESLLESDVYKDFGAMKSQWQAKCAKCEFLEFCMGDCLKHRLRGPAATPRSLSALCEGWRMFYSHALPKLRRLASKAKTMRARSELAALLAERPADFNRLAASNPDCPCGSGRKLSKCCLGRVLADARRKPE